MPISATDLNKAYLAYFGRPADLTGKTYFATLEQADHWLAQADKLHSKVGVGTLLQKIAMRLRALNPEQ